jgi:putative ABC transport system ATP-binding protein
LDSVSGALVLDALVQAVRERDVTVVVVTHDRDVASYADREIVVRDGLIASEPLASTRVEMGA